jgi:predicted methyltransferase
VRRETFTQRSFYKEVSTQKSFYAEKFLHKGQTFCTEKPSRTKRQQKLQLQKGISAPKGKNERYFTRILFKESPAPKYAKMEKNLRNHHHRP